MRPALVLVSLAAVLAALSACGQEADPSPAARSAAASQASTPTPPPPTPTPTPSLSPLPAAFSPGDRSDPSQGLYEAPSFSLSPVFGEPLTLQGFLDEHEAVVLVFYRGFF